MKLLRLLIIPLVIGLMGCSSSESDQAGGKSTPPRRFTVKIQLVKKSRVPILISFPGTVASADTAFLMPKVVGYISSFRVKPGETFKKGDLLVTIKSKEFVDKEKFARSAVKEAVNGEKQAALGLNMATSGLKQAEAQYVLAEKTYKRFKNLMKTESVSKQEFDEVEAKYKAALSAKNIAEEKVKLAREKLSQVKIKKHQAMAMLDEVKTYLGYTYLRAPFNGIVLEKLMDVGNLASPSKPILKIGSHRNVVFAQVNGSVIRDTKVGDEVRVDVPSAGESFKARVLEINPSIDPATRSFRVKLSGNPHLVPGMYGNVSFEKGSLNVIVVPKSAVLSRGQLQVVFIDKDNRAEMRLVKTGRTFDDSVEILSGLYPGEKLVLDKGEQLHSGDFLEE